MKEESKLKKIITLENMLCLLVVLGPIFDIASFLFRNYFETTFSVSTFIRPIIPVLVSICIFIKAKKKQKLQMLGIAVVFAIYSVIHLYLTKTQVSGMSYGSVKEELQYIFNFTFLSIYLYIFYYVFKDKNTERLKKSISIMLGIYIASIYLSIITGTSSQTYVESNTGFKGWIESANSLSAILVLSMFVVLQGIKDKNIKWRIYNIIVSLLTGIYLAFLIGTRTGLLGFFIAVAIFVLAEMLFSKNKKIIIAGITIFVLGLVVVGVFGSSTLIRRADLKHESETLIDETTGEKAYMTLSTLKIKNDIVNNRVEEGYLTEAQSKSMLDLYEYTKTHDISGTDRRKQQFMYNIFLIKNQKSIPLILFGNGWATNFYELLMENELPMILFNFGIIGFGLYLLPFIIALCYSFIKAIKNRKSLDSEYVMLLSGLGLTIVLAIAQGYVFFATSSMSVIVAITVMLLNKAKSFEKTEKEKIKK